MATAITDRVYGCLIGGAIGDALGAPVESWSYHEIRREYGKIEEFQEFDISYATGSPGSITGDTTLRNYICLAIVRENGRILPGDFATVLKNQVNADRVWVNEEIVAMKLHAGADPWEAGRGTIPAATATMAIAPVGIINAGNPRQAYQDAIDVAAVLQEGENRNAAGTVAAGVAQALVPGTDVETVLAVMQEYSSDIVFRSIDLALGLAAETNSVDQFAEQFYESRLDWRWPGVNWDRERYARGELHSSDSLESLPVAMAILQLCDGDVDRSIVEAASFGRDCDTIASLVGNIAGSIHGASGIRQEWIDRCERANRDVFDELGRGFDGGFAELADLLIDALAAERDRANQREAELTDLLEETYDE